MRYHLEYFAKQNVSRHADISLDVDADRDGVVEKNNPNKVSCDGSLFGSNNGMLSGAILTSLYFWSKRGAAYESQSHIGPIYNFISCHAANFIHDHLSACKRVYRGFSLHF